MTAFFVGSPCCLLISTSVFPCLPACLSSLLHSCGTACQSAYSNITCMSVCVSLFLRSDCLSGGSVHLPHVSSLLSIYGTCTVFAYAPSTCLHDCQAVLINLSVCRLLRGYQSLFLPICQSWVFSLYIIKLFVCNPVSLICMLPSSLLAFKIKARQDMISQVMRGHCIRGRVTR
jgi:hypothetical protein